MLSSFSLVSVPKIVAWPSRCVCVSAVYSFKAVYVVACSGNAREEAKKQTNKQTNKPECKREKVKQEESQGRWHLKRNVQQLQFPPLDPTQTNGHRHRHMDTPRAQDENGPCQAKEKGGGGGSLLCPFCLRLAPHTRRGHCRAADGDAKLCPARRLHLCWRPRLSL